MKQKTAVIARLRGATLEECAAAAGLSKGYCSKVITAHIRQVEAGDGDGDPVRAWQVARAEKTKLEAQHRKMLIDQMTNALIPQEEVKEVFGRVFAAYRQATREISRRYGPEAAKILQEAERSALRVRAEDRRC